MNQQLMNLLKRWRVALPVATVLVMVITGSVGAIGAGGASMGGVETALPAEGIPINPAAAGAIESNALYVGASLPFNQERFVYAAMHQPGSAMDTSLYGTLSFSHNRQAYLDSGGATAYIKNECVSYQIAYPFGSSIAGAGVRWLRDTDEGAKTTVESWRMDLGWQQTLAPGLTAGLAVIDVAGSGSPKLAWRAGLAYQVGTALVIAADAWDFNTYKPASFAVGLQVAPWPQLRLRGGYQQDAGQDAYTTGGSLVLGNWQLDASARLGASASGLLGIAVHF